MTPELLRQLQSHRARKQPIALATELASGHQRLLTAAEPAGRLGEAAQAALRLDRAQQLELDGKHWFVMPFNPALRLIVVGAVHIAQPLTRMAQELGFDSIVVDPRSAFSTQERFPGVALRCGWPDAELEALELDARCAVVTLTHDPKLDDPALKAALASPAFYVGALGSRKTQSARLRRLRAAGFGEDSLERIHGPVGLPLGGRAPAEIAVSILAQVVHVLRHARPEPTMKADPSDALR